MKILFICGSLEPGRDGVGDYSRRLAAELIRQGHDTAIVALNDRHISAIEQTNQESEGTNVAVLRLPASLKNKERYGLVKKFIKKFGPEWLSLQFVPYAFQKRGLPFGLGRKLAKIGKGRKWHVMFHELWVYNQDAKSKIIRIIQKALIYFIYKKLSLLKINTSILFYKNNLNKIGIKSDLLGLFGNIPKTTKNLERKNLEQILYFGGIPSGNSKELIISKLLDFYSNNKNFRLIIIAPDSKQKTDFVQSILKKTKTVHEKSIEIKQYSFLSETELSNLFSSSAVGISRSPIDMLGKSGSAIAMLEYGLPLWIPQWNGKTDFEYAFRKELIYSDLAKAVNNTAILEYHSLLPEIANIFITQLSQK